MFNLYFLKCFFGLICHINLDFQGQINDKNVYLFFLIDM